jgi:hypothetical protein
MDKLSSLVKENFQFHQVFLFNSVLAEKSTIQGVIAFYDQLKEFFGSNLKAIVPPSTSCSCLTMIDTDGYRPLVNTFMPKRISHLWKDIFCVNPTGNWYTETILNKMGWTEVLFEPWRMNGEDEQDLQPLEKTDGGTFSVPFESLQPLMKRRMQYAVPLKHSIPLGSFL